VSRTANAVVFPVKRKSGDQEHSACSPFLKSY